MQKRLLISAILAASWVAVVPAFAATPTATATATATATPIPNDKTNYLGDRIVFKQDITAYLQTYELKDGKLGVTEIPICVPWGTYLRGIGQVKSGDHMGSPVFTPDCNWHDFVCHQCDFEPTQCDSVAGSLPIKKGSQIRIPDDTLQNTPPNRYGFTYGALVVPFKFELTGKKEFKGSASVAPYMGYRLGFESSGIELALPVVFAGVSNVSATKTTTTTTAATATTPASSTDSTSTSDLAAFSYGVGVIGILKQTFQFGAVVGFDHAGSGQGFQYNDKPWLAVEIGYQFSQ